MLRPATPLTILLFISFVLLLISVISTPIVHGIPLATFKGVNFGVFGYCKGSVCSGVRIGYNTDGIFGNDNVDDDFDLPAPARHSLSSLLVVHPVAAFLNLVCLGLAVAAHFHAPSHSARYLLGLLILLLPTLLVTLLAFLVDILLFVPHLQWAGWIVLASTILVTASGVVTCAMRRTLVSRKARKKRIAENAEMSGENFYNRQADEAKIPMPPPLTAETKAPMVNGAPGADNLPSFTTFDPTRRSEENRSQGPSMTQSGTTAVPPMPNRSNTGDAFYNGGPSSRSQSQPPRSNLRDQYGNPIAPGNAYVGSMPRNRSEERRGPGQYRDDGYGMSRSGYPSSRGRGGYPPRGSYGPRGGFAGTGSRPHAPRDYNGRGGYPPAPPRGYGERTRGGYGGGAAMAGGLGGAMAAGALMNRGPRQPPPGYPPPGQGMPPNQYAVPEGYSPPSRPTSDHYDQRDDVRYQPTSPQDYTRGQPEQYVAYAAQAPPPARQPSSNYGSRAQSPAGGARRASPPPPVPDMAGQDGPPEIGNPYAQDEYVPPRQQWSAHNAATIPNNNLQTSSPINRLAQQSSPAELATAHSTVAGPNHPTPNLSRPRRVNSGGSDIYYEDVNPRFASESDPVPPLPSDRPIDPNYPSQPPHGLGPSTYQSRQDSQGHLLRPISDALDPTSSNEDLQQGARSPAESETSNFTSVSQRGVNPNWRPGVDGQGAFGSYAPGPGPAGVPYGGATGVGRKPVGGGSREAQMKREVLLTGNPDFEIPGMGAPRRVGGGGGGGPRGGGGIGGAMRGGAMRGPGMGMGFGASMVSGEGGRYPAP